MPKPKQQVVGDLTPAPYNPRKISRPQMEALGRSMREFGDLGGIVVNTLTGRVIGGHQRLKHLDAKWKIDKRPAIDNNGTIAEGWIQTPYGRFAYREVRWSEEKEKAANLAANKHGGEFDDAAVAALLADIGKTSFDLDLTGFLENERLDLMGDNEAKGDPDELPDAPRRRTKRGELWAMGEHRLFVGDATEEKSWMKLFSLKANLTAQSSAAMIFTDPPYGISYTGTPSKQWDEIENDAKVGDDLLKMLNETFRFAIDYSHDDAAWYVWHASGTRDDFARALRDAGLQERQYLIWAKPGINFGRADYQWAHEPCFYASRADQRPAFYGDRAQPTVWRLGHREAKQVGTVIGPGVVVLDGSGSTLYVQARQPKGKKVRQIRLEGEQPALLAGAKDEQSTVWEVARDHGYKHPTQKPVELARRAIENSSRSGEIIADPFLGSGSTLIAAEITKRRCYGFEIETKYADLILERWERFTGRKASREGK